MPSLFVLATPENRPVVEVAERDADVSVHRSGPYFVLASAEGFSIDRRATGCRHAVWYSCVAGLSGFRIEGWDKDSLRLAVR
ncbi:hypothetical protein [Amycolatopsis pithecellobii]|uniref:Uncharacterized protein n=1 Tax=Amycolatopsis pithecellobii TaxID=664692 RepID=A0A6N7Z059_9PSEU|nr:hypothetical protein [Amycolatopsis pithecellobii]MTD52930.1 hypothetical protein [Amycolatopsis pithecellobii]